MQDLIIGPQRAPGIPGFEAACAAAKAAGALGCSLAGSGPSLFAWVTSEEQGKAVQDAVKAAFLDHGAPAANSWMAPLSSEGAKVVFSS